VLKYIQSGPVAAIAALLPPKPKYQYRIANGSFLVFGVRGE
jgi:hypothetical protein